MLFTGICLSTVPLSKKLFCGIESGKVFINESLCHYYKFWRKCKTLWSEEPTEAFWVSNGQIKIRIEPDGAFTQITHITQICRNYFEAMIFSLNKFTTASHHWYRSFVDIFA